MALPSQWPQQTRTAVLHAVGLARFALMHVRGWCADSRIGRVRLAAERDGAVCKVAVLEEEARILRARMASVPPARRPHYLPVDRMAILTLRAGAGWNAAETARRLQITEATLASWKHRLDEKGPRALVQLRQPVNRFPDFVTAIVQELAQTCPSLGKRRIADLLARAGLHLAASTVERHKRKAPAPQNEPNDAAAAASGDQRAASPPAAGKRVTARAPHNVWHIDLTLLPTGFGWWVPWWPFSMQQSWPFCFWLGLVLDHYTRSIVHWQLFRKQPTSEQVVAMLERARVKNNAAPRHLISDQGAQFGDAYLAWCASRGVKPRYGAVGEHGSIAIIERFFRSLKTEMLRRLPLVPLSMPKMYAEMAAYVVWYNQHRPHQGLRGLTPGEKHGDAMPLKDRALVEPRPTYPLARGDPERTRRRVQSLELVVERLHGRDHLPIVSLREAA